MRYFFRAANDQAGRHWTYEFLASNPIELDQGIEWARTAYVRSHRAGRRQAHLFLQVLRFGFGVSWMHVGFASGLPRPRQWTARVCAAAKQSVTEVFELIGDRFAEVMDAQGEIRYGADALGEFADQCFPPMPEYFRMLQAVEMGVPAVLWYAAPPIAPAPTRLHFQIGPESFDCEPAIGGGGGGT